AFSYTGPDGKWRSSSQRAYSIRETGKTRLHYFYNIHLLSTHITLESLTYWQREDLRENQKLLIELKLCAPSTSVISAFYISNRHRISILSTSQPMQCN